MIAPADDPMRFSRCISDGKQAYFPHKTSQLVPEKYFRDATFELKPG